MSVTQILFWFLSVLAVISAINVVISKNPVFSVIWLIIAFFSISGHYILLNAQFLAVVNIIVYAGAIMVLFLFVIMLLDLKAEQRRHIRKVGLIAGVISVGAIAAIFAKTFIASRLNVPPPAQVTAGGTQALGKLLFTQYLLPFEILSVLLLVAMIGAILLSKRELE